MLEKPPQKVAYLGRNSVVSEIFHLLGPTAQLAEFMFQNVVYRATVYRTRGCAKCEFSLMRIFPITKSHNWKGLIVIECFL